jgi:hypothetical protein
MNEKYIAIIFLSVVLMLMFSFTYFSYRRERNRFKKFSDSIRAEEKEYFCLKSRNPSLKPEMLPSHYKFFLEVEDVFSTSGGTLVVADNRISMGTPNIKSGDSVKIFGKEFIDNAKCIKVGEVAQLIYPTMIGSSIGVLLSGVNKEDIEEGDIIFKPIDEEK